MSAIFANFRQKIGVFRKKQCYDHFFQTIAAVSAKNAKIFGKFIGENIFKIITSVSVLKNIFA
jgi:hypothetical protein